MSLTNRSKVVAKKELNWVEKLYIPAILQGLAITMSHFFKKKPTVQYPEQKRYIAPVYRGLHVLKRDEQGRENCTACGLCAVACPAEAITMEAAERRKAKNISIAKKNMRLCMKSTCCAVFSVACVKRLVQKMLSILQIACCRPTINATHLYMARISW
jgi:formate hydrogenlyase subunit 6/NADH:ubiquinone oxidoreductase subunit I